jgi:hypothetical protein
VDAMEMMFNERLPVRGGRRLHHRDPQDFYREESENENSGFGHEFNPSVMVVEVMVIHVKYNTT